MIRTVAWAFFKRGFLEAASYRGTIFLRVIGIVFTLSSLYFLSRFVGVAPSAHMATYGGDYLGFWLVGMILLHLQFTSVSAYPRSIREAQLAGTLEAMLATPTPAWLVLLCTPIFEFVGSILWAAAYLIFGVWLFHVRLGQANLLSLGVAVPLSLMAFSTLGFIGATLTMFFRRADPISTFLGGLSALLGGVFYPPNVLPPWLRWVGKALPITHALEVTRRALFLGATISELGPSLLGLLLFFAVFAPLGLGGFAWSLNRARREGSLTHF